MYLCVFTVKQDAGSQKGTLTAELFSWKSLLNGPVILQLHTYVTKAAMISLPPGFVFSIILQVDKHP